MVTLTDRRTSPARPKKAAEQAELEKLRRQVAQQVPWQDVAKRDAALDVLGKAHALLALHCESAD